MRIESVAGQATMFGPDLDAGRTSPEPTAPQEGKTSEQCWKRSCGSKNHNFMLLDLRPGAGNILGPYWEINPVWLGQPGMLNFSESPRDAVVSSLSRILMDSAPSKYSLSRTACLGILRRAKEREKRLPTQLEKALRIQAGLQPLHRTETEITPAGFLPESSTTAKGVGYQEECAPTLKAGGKSSAVMLPVLCLNDQGGSVMECSEDVTGTLRAQEHGHQPLVFANHSADTRFRGPCEVIPTISAQYGTGGNNTPLVADGDAICITGNAIDRKPENGGNGLGIDVGVAFTLTATDHHAVFSRQRVDQFAADSVASTESARQHKDATDLVLDGNAAGDSTLLLRRLMPVECERLQGYPDAWTDIPGASDSARYKALGNSVAIPCVEQLMLGIALVLRNAEDCYGSVEELCKML